MLINRAIIIFIFLIICNNIFFAINKKTGCITGKIRFITNRQFWSLREGEYYDNIILTVINLKSKKIYSAKTNQFGIYFFENLPAGDYEFIKWKRKITLPGRKISVFLTGNLNELQFNIIENNIFCFKEIIAKVNIPKEFTYKYEISYIFIDENIEELKNNLDSKKNNYNNYIWRPSSKKENFIVEKLSKETKIKNLIALSENDFYTMNNLYKSGEFYLSFMLFYRILKNLLSAYIIKYIDENFTEQEDIKELIKLTKINFSPEELIIIYDIISINERIKIENNNENFKLIFTKSYFEEYLNKIEIIIKKIKIFL